MTPYQQLNLLGKADTGTITFKDSSEYQKWLKKRKNK